MIFARQKSSKYFVNLMDFLYKARDDKPPPHPAMRIIAVRRPRAGPRASSSPFKVPQAITHDKILVGCDADLEEFFRRTAILGPKLGPMVF